MTKSCTFKLNMKDLILRTIYYSILIISCSACTNQVAEMIEQPMMPDSSKKKVTYLALGDSYTIGQSVTPTSSYPLQLADSLNLDSVMIDNTLIIAKTGWRTDNLVRGIQQANIVDTFDLVSLLIGVNNQFQNRPISQYAPEFTDLLKQAIEFAGGDESNVFVLSIPDYGFTPYGQPNQPRISEEINLYNEINFHIC